MEMERFKKGIEEIKTIKLSKEEKPRIFSSIRYSINSKEGPKNGRLSSERLGYFSKYAYYFSATITFVFIFGFFSHRVISNSLPGEALYSAKIEILEPLRYGVAIGQEAKAEIAIRNFSERLMEVEMLANKGLLSQVSEKDLEENIIKHAENISLVTNSSQQLENSLAPEVKINVEATVEAHQKVLKKMEEKSKSEESRNRLSKIIKTIKPDSSAKSEEVSLAFMASEVFETGRVESPATTSKENGDLEKNIMETEKVIYKLKKKIDNGRKGKTKVNRSVFEESSQSLLEAESALMRAKENVKSGKREDAINDLKNSKKSVKTSEKVFKASRNLSDDE
jgi:hypothetical protein